MICRGLCACTEMLWMCVLYESFRSRVIPRTFGCIAMGSALLFIVRSRLLVYSIFVFSIPFKCTLYLLYTSRGVFIWRINYRHCHHNCKHLYISSRQHIHALQNSSDTDIQHSVLIGDVNAHSTLWHLYTDNQKTSNSSSDHITLNTNTTTNITRYHDGV